ncbi:MAG: tetratricopeptide repeat protein [Alphaproteobacteria bacterium]|nr:tetratricopeptide repeat protein [Alphaproteobacteria bacterium]
MMSPDDVRTRPAWVRRLDRLLTALARVGGRAFGRPDEALLNRLTGRAKGGLAPAEGQGSQALVAGRRALEDGRYAEALHQFGLAVERAPQDPWPHHGRGDAFQLLGDHARALEAYEAALGLAPDLALPHNGRGNALAALGRLDEARSAWARALELDPALPWPREALARHAEDEATGAPPR